MKKVLTLIFILMLIFIIACQQAVKKEAPATRIETTRDATVDAVGNDLDSADGVSRDLSADQLGDLDSGLSDVQNI